MKYSFGKAIKNINSVKLLNCIDTIDRGDVYNNHCHNYIILVHDQSDYIPLMTVCREVTSKVAARLEKTAQLMQDISNYNTSSLFNELVKIYSLSCHSPMLNYQLASWAKLSYSTIGSHNSISDLYDFFNSIASYPGAIEPANNLWSSYRIVSSKTTADQPFSPLVITTAVLCSISPTLRWYYHVEGYKDISGTKVFIVNATDPCKLLVSFDQISEVYGEPINNVMFDQVWNNTKCDDSHNTTAHHLCEYLKSLITLEILGSI